MELILRSPTEPEFQKISDYIRDFELDNRHLELHQFIAAFRNNELVGFGRLREYSDCTELCSLGVITPLRRKGIGKEIVSELIKSTSKNIYLVCIIPEYFTPFNFKITKKFPDSIQNKLEYCSEQLVVPEQYVAMVLNQNSI
jgi:N-acetylglutamate synthase-like GNAT family acetyltransferase